MTDAQLVQRAASDVMGWKVRETRGGTFMADTPEGAIGIWGDTAIRSRWRPLEIDGDALEMIDKLDPTGCTLEKSGALWTVTLDGWATASDPDRRRAIVLACLARVEVRP